MKRKSSLSGGSVIKVFDGVALCNGLASVGLNELVVVETTAGVSVLGLAFELLEDLVGVLLLDNQELVKAGDAVSITGDFYGLFVSDSVIGKVIDPLGKYLLEPGSLSNTKDSTKVYAEVPAASIIQRKDVYRPLYTGITAIDTLVPIGKGQRQLILGDRGTGKSSIALDIILNQKNNNVICIYAFVGQKASTVYQVAGTLKNSGSLAHTVVVASLASQSAALQYLTPFIACGVAEYFAKKGRDVLVVYDDLTRHAFAYREVSLVLGRGSGREAYPGDVFYLHSRLLERAGQFSDELGGGSITALPLIETLSSDISSYIPTNVISITDGQLFLDQELFNLGQRPAINIGSSVSRVGSAAQPPLIKSVAGELKLNLSLFRELEAFSQFGTELDKETKAKLDRGKRISALLRQDERKLMSVADQFLLLHTVLLGKLDSVPVERVSNFMTAVIKEVKELDKTFYDVLGSGKKLAKEEVVVLEDVLTKAVSRVPHD